MAILTLVLLNLDIPCLCKQCRSRSVGFWRSQLILICTVCHKVCEFIGTIRIKCSGWLKIRSGCSILIYSAGQGLSQNIRKLQVVWPESVPFAHMRLLVFLCLGISFSQSRPITKTACSNILKILPPKHETFQMKNSGSFHISAQNIDCGYSLELPH